jgi:hypothetical protein
MEWIHRNTRTFLMNRNANDFIPLRFVKTEGEASAVIEELKGLWGKYNNESHFKDAFELWFEKQRK